MTIVPRPTTQLTDEQRSLLDAAKRAAQDSHQAKREAKEKEKAGWEALLTARAGGVPDELLCDETGFSRATLNRRFGPRVRQETGPEADASA